MYIRIYIYIQIHWSLGGWGPKAGNALQEVCVCMKWGTMVALVRLASGMIFFV